MVCVKFCCLRANDLITDRDTGIAKGGTAQTEPYDGAHFARAACHVGNILSRGWHAHDVSGVFPIGIASHIVGACSALCDAPKIAFPPDGASFTRGRDPKVVRARDGRGVVYILANGAQFIVASHDDKTKIAAGVIIASKDGFSRSKTVSTRG